MIFKGQYSFSSGSVGLTYIGVGVGSLIGLAIVGDTSDLLMGCLTKKNGGESKPEYRLPVMNGACILIPDGLFLLDDLPRTTTIGFLSSGMVVVFVGLVQLIALATVTVW